METSRSTIVRILCLTFLIVAFSTEPLFAQALRTKIQGIVNKGKDIRMKFVSIATKGQEIRGFEKLSDAVQRGSETIQQVEDRIDSLVNRLSILQLPFPNNLGIPSHNVRILGRSVGFPGLTAPFPNFNRNFPKLSDFFSQFLDPVDHVLDRMLELATEMDDSMGAAMARVHATPAGKMSPTGSDFPTAQYLDPEGIRTHLGNAAFGRWTKAINEVVGGAADIIDKPLGQNIVVAAGGNFQVVSSIFFVLKALGAIFKEVVDDIGGDITSAEVTASYQRLEFIHDQVDTLDDKVEVLDGKVDVLDGKVDVVDGKVNVLTDEFRDWRTHSIRTRIEINLAGRSDHPHAIAIYILPAQFGGYLEVARDIVQTTIANMIAAGQNVYQAAMWFSRANTEFTAGRYKKAYEFYSNSYAEATK